MAIKLVEEQEITVEQELAAYKNFVNNLKYGFRYTDEETGIEIVKSRNNNVSFVRRSDTCQKMVYDINPSQDIDIEILESFLQPIVDLVPHHITFTDNQGYITMANKQVSFDYNVPFENLVGMHISDLLEIPNEQITIMETIEKKKDIEKREVLDRNYGIISTKIIEDSNGEIKRIIGSFQFLNTIREAEKRGAAGKIATGIAHEIRNPLTIVSGFLQMMQNSVTGEYASIVTDVLLPELDRANRIISNFLASTKEAQEQNYTINPNKYISENLSKLFQSEILLNEIDFSIELDDELNVGNIKINRDEITQVFLNLMKNSIEASNKSDLKISISTQKMKDKVRIMFSDNGSGISPAQLESIFDPFFTTKHEGTGLGLSVSKKIIDNHGGAMLVKSNLDGTTFEIQFPLFKEDM